MAQMIDHCGNLHEDEVPCPKCGKDVCGVSDVLESPDGMLYDGMINDIHCFHCKHIFMVRVDIINDKSVFSIEPEEDEKEDPFS